MRLKHSIYFARADRVGPNGITAAALADALKRTEPALAWLRARHADGALPLLRLPAKHDDFVSIKDAARRLTATGASDIVFLGVGGSSLGGQTLAQLADYAVPGAGLLRSGPRLHFLDNLDPDTYATLLEKLPLATTHFVAISKSGGTGETLMQATAVLAAMKAEGLAVRIPDLFLGITEAAKGGKRSGLRVLFDEHRIPMLEHDPAVGGRYSVLTNVGLLPAAIVGLDITAIRGGAGVALAPVLASRPPAEVPSAFGAALAVTLGASKPMSVMLAYADRLDRSEERRVGKECRSRWSPY